jgi:acetyl esterase
MSVVSTVASVVLEPAAQEFAEATARPPYLFDLGPIEGRRTVDRVQAGEIDKPDVDVEDATIAGGPSGAVSIRILRPKGATGRRPVILYTHGAGWVFGNADTHDRLVRELVAGTGAAVVFTNYSLSPEARYPIAIEEIYGALEWIADHGAEKQLDGSRIAVAGDSVGGNMTAAITLMAKQRRGPQLAAQVLFHPVTDASFDTDSYRQFAVGYFLRRAAMRCSGSGINTPRMRTSEARSRPRRCGPVATSSPACPRRS